MNGEIWEGEMGTEYTVDADLPVNFLSNETRLEIGYEKLGLPPPLFGGLHKHISSPGFRVSLA